MACPSSVISPSPHLSRRLKVGAASTAEPIVVIDRPVAARTLRQPLERLLPGRDAPLEVRVESGIGRLGLPHRARRPFDLLETPAAELLVLVGRELARLEVHVQLAQLSTEPGPVRTELLERCRVLLVGDGRDERPRDERQHGHEEQERTDRHGDHRATSGSSKTFGSSSSSSGTERPGRSVRHGHAARTPPSTTITMPVQIQKTPGSWNTRTVATRWVGSALLITTYRSEPSVDRIPTSVMRCCPVYSACSARIVPRASPSGPVTPNVPISANFTGVCSKVRSEKVTV